MSEERFLQGWFCRSCTDGRDRYSLEIKVIIFRQFHCPFEEDMRKDFSLGFEIGTPFSVDSISMNAQRDEIYSA